MSQAERPASDLMRRRPLRVCYFGTYRAEYSRNRILIAGLRQAGVEVIECHQPLWRGIEDRVQTVRGGWRSPAFWGRVLAAYLRLVWRFFRLADFDVMLVGYPGQMDVFLARLLCGLRRKPLVWDVFMSIYLIAMERGLAERSPLAVSLLRRVEKWACAVPDLLIIDTAAYAAWFQATHGVPLGRFRLVPTGADDQVYRPQEADEAGSSPADRPCQVVYHGTFIPNHGVATIVEAARLLAGQENLRFLLIGEGPEKETAERLAREYRLSNLAFLGWLEPESLAASLAQADICLGAFGTTPQSLMTVQNKIYEALAMRKPVITGDSPAVRQAFRHGEHLYLCERENAASLAEAILFLYNQPALRQALARQGYACFLQAYTPLRLGETLKGHLQSCLEPRA